MASSNETDTKHTYHYENDKGEIFVVFVHTIPPAYTEATRMDNETLRLKILDFTRRNKLPLAIYLDAMKNWPKNIEELNITSLARDFDFDDLLKHFT